jgi:hypothetical protein
MEHIDAESILDLIAGHVDGGWNDVIKAYANASNDGEILYIEVEDGQKNKKRFELTIEQV